jgi:hypothetical protein
MRAMTLDDAIRQAKANEKRAIVGAFLEGMYYVGKLPSRSEITPIAIWLVKHSLKGEKRLSIEQLVSEQMDALHQRTGNKPETPAEEKSND